jgi:hypothetical protein
MRAPSQFPQPDLHRLDMRPYGLHAKIAKKSEWILRDRESYLNSAQLFFATRVPSGTLGAFA